MRLVQIPLEELWLNYMRSSARLKWIPAPASSSLNSQGKKKKRASLGEMKCSQAEMPHFLSFKIPSFISSFNEIWIIRCKKLQ